MRTLVVGGRLPTANCPTTYCPTAYCPTAQLPTAYCPTAYCPTAYSLLPIRHNHGHNQIQQQSSAKDDHSYQKGSSYHCRVEVEKIAQTTTYSEYFFILPNQSSLHNILVIKILQGKNRNILDVFENKYSRV